MTMESVAGKNPVTHVGKLYNLLAGLLAEDLVAELSGVSEATCHLVSRIGRPVDDPRVVDVRLRADDPAAAEAVQVEPIVRRHLERATSLWQELASGAIELDRWPLRG